MRDKRIGFAITGSHCTLAKIIGPITELVEDGNAVFPIISASVVRDTRFGLAKDWLAKFESITGNPVIDSIVAAEPVGPQLNLDVVVVAPATGNTLAKLASAITDTTVTMAVKAQLRNERPVVLALATNDGLAGSARNIGALLDKKNVFFVPFGQDDPHGKPRSLVSDMALLGVTIQAALAGKQIQPILIR
mgnify:CR=1 FL=1